MPSPCNWQNSDWETLQDKQPGFQWKISKEGEGEDKQKENLWNLNGSQFKLKKKSFKIVEDMWIFDDIEELLLIFFFW